MRKLKWIGDMMEEKVRKMRKSAKKHARADAYFVIKISKKF